MPILIWKNSFNLGIEIIDEQHRHLIDTLNKLFDSLNEGKENVVLGETLNELINYALAHFETEEEYFKKFNFEGAKEHILEHQKLKERVATFKEQFKEKGSRILNEVTQLIGNWFSDHEENYDRQYVKCFKEHGL